MRARATERVLDDLVERVDGWLDDVERLPFDPRTSTTLRRVIEYRRRRLARTVSPA